MNNIFILDYKTRLKSWVELRTKLQGAPIKDQVIMVDDFWQRVPIQAHYLHTDFIKDWPTPWELLSDNSYCYYARALGMIYTLLLLGNKDIELLEAVDDNSNEVVLVFVDKSYVLNYWPSTTLTNKISDFTILKTISIEQIKNKIG